jgi:hypothetical protein
MSDQDDGSVATLKPVASPVESPGLVVTTKGSTVEWFNAEPDYPQFEIKFGGPISPASEGHCIPGTTDQSAVIHVSGPDGVYHYSVHYKGSSTKKPKWGGMHVFVVGRCELCP